LLQRYCRLAARRSREYHCGMDSVLTLAPLLLCVPPVLCLLGVFILPSSLITYRLTLFFPPPWQIAGHLDSVPAGPGINDDGSGSATVLEIARQIALRLYAVS
jgi:hypothetical protein